MPDLAGLDRIDHRPGHTHHRVMPEADGDGLFRLIGCKAFFRQRRLDDRLKIFVADMRHARPCHQPRRKDSGLIAVFGPLDTVGRHQNRTRERIKFLVLILPGTAIVADQVLVFLQTRIRTARQHFTMGIDIDAAAFGLLEQQFQVLQVVSGYQNRLALDRSHPYRRRLGVSVGPGIGGIQQFHHLEIDFANLHRHSNQFIDVSRPGAGQEIQRLMKERIYAIIFFTQNLCMVGIRRGALESIGDQFLQAGHIRAQRIECFGDTECLSLSLHLRPGLGCLPLGRIGRLIRAALFGVFGLQVILDLSGPANQCFQTNRVEVHIRHCAEQRLDHK